MARRSPIPAVYHPRSRPGGLEQTGDDAVRNVRYLDVLPLRDGGYRIWYEARLPDESHELRTELIGAA